MTIANDKIGHCETLVGLPDAATRFEVVVREVRTIARDINLYVLERPNGGALPLAEAGAHITLYLPNGLERQYSLALPANEPTSYTIGVKRDPGSRGGSAWVHDELRLGMHLVIEGPRNNFPLNEDARETVLIAGGIGITPIYAMAKRLEDLGRTFKLHYSCRSRADAAFLPELSDSSHAAFHFDDEQQGRFLDIGQLVRDAPAGAHLYCCGPAPMLSAFEAAGAAAGRSVDELHVEWFTQKHEAARQGGFMVELARSKKELFIPEGQSILNVLLEAGVEVSRSCEEGVCGSCETRVLAGIPDHRDSVLTDAERAQNKCMMVCCSGAKSAKIILDL